MELIKELGGATTWGDDYYVTYNYRVSCNKIDEAIKILAKDSTTDPNEFAKEMRQFNL